MPHISSTLERLRWTIALALVVLAAAFAAFSAAHARADAAPSVARSSWGSEAVTVEVARSSWGAADMAADVA